MSEKTNVIAFPKGSSLDVDDEFKEVVSQVIRLGLERAFVVGIDASGEVQIICSDDATLSGLFFMLHRAAAVLEYAAEDENMIDVFDEDIEDEEDDYDDEDDESPYDDE